MTLKDSNSMKITLLLIALTVTGVVWWLTSYPPSWLRSKAYKEAVERTRAVVIPSIAAETMTECPKCGEKSRYDAFKASPGRPNMLLCPRCAEAVPLPMVKANAVYSFQSRMNENIGRVYNE